MAPSHSFRNLARISNDRMLCETCETQKLCEKSESGYAVLRCAETRKRNISRAVSDDQILSATWLCALPQM